MVTLLKAMCGIPATGYTISKAWKGKSPEVKDGVNVKLIQLRVTREHKSDTAKPRTGEQT